mmetsp:Transcript_17540/g.35093  ORF Transcript_17540/g.35093 Transcript_17540/m.35093 type:complete len:94 (+) Transcript_17540:760-1041(+)
MWVEFMEEDNMEGEGQLYSCNSRGRVERGETGGQPIEVLVVEADGEAILSCMEVVEEEPLGENMVEEMNQGQDPVEELIRVREERCLGDLGLL